MAAKHLLDIVLASIALAAFFPLGIVIILILKFTGEGEIFYVQERVGMHGRSFGLLKFATMLKDSPNIGPGDITVRDDPRVLPFGRFLRKTKLNEIPQLINILMGDMSIVGPRPQTPKYFALFPENSQKKILDLKPGLTGLGSIVFRDEEKMAAASGMEQIEFHKKVIAPYKGELEIWYRDHRSFWMDIKLILLTAWMVLFPDSRLYHFFLPAIPAAPRVLAAQ
ncbi:MAG: sugar transferase [Desulforhabdus sp.]|jgi:lipopolysaccharide/colanic/teichoic acid biosynthesis glycosyltransferase|nr:sugar transferase [Desulforhabdus sp.]